jgi:hypothetical protein
VWGQVVVGAASTQPSAVTGTVNGVPCAASVPPVRSGGATQYEIVVRGKLGDRFASAFDGLTIDRHPQETHLSGEVVDQAQLHALLDRIRALGIELVSVTPLRDAAP